MDPAQRSEIVQRLHCTAGHLDAVLEMVETRQACEQILHQMNAVQAALRVAATKLIVCQVQSSQAVLRDSPSRKRRISELKRLLSLYTTFNKCSAYHSEVFDE